MTVIIAEAGLNFSGSVDKALKMVDAAKRAGADAVKFQAFLPQGFDSNLARFTLTLQQWQKVFGHALEQEITFMCTPFDRWAFDMLRDMGVKHWKIPSGELTNDAYLQAIPEQATHYYLSTGMANENEIDHALAVLPGPMDKEVCLMYCVSGYPVPHSQLALHTILDWSLCRYPQYTIGYSDHSEYHGWAAGIAVALGAEVIERHFMLEGSTIAGDNVPDRAVSTGDGEVGLEWYIRIIRNTEKVLKSTPQKQLQPCEAAMLKARNRSGSLVKEDLPDQN